MTFEEFRFNVEQWAEARGIYEHSTALAQALKAVSEVGELADAVIKGDREALKDAIGDVAVCLVNVARMENKNIDMRRNDFDLGEPRHKAVHMLSASIAYHVSDLATDIAYYGSPLTESFVEAMANMRDLAMANGTTLEECCAAAWNEIKDRKGRMVPGGAFVKEGEA